MNGRTAVVTGGSRGIGRAVALGFAGNGANVAVVYNGATEAADTVCREAESLGIRALNYKCDVSDFASAKAVCERIYADFGRVDILVNNAGITKDNLLLKMSEAEFDGVLGVNLKGAFNFSKHLSRYIIKSPCGRIINVSSVSGITGNPGQTNYSSAKAGMLGLTKTLAKELASRGVTCNAIAPGFIDTDMTKGMPQAVFEQAIKNVPLRRMGNPDEVAALASFLASDAAAYITGEVIRIDGGMCI